MRKVCLVFLCYLHADPYVFPVQPKYMPGYETPLELEPVVGAQPITFKGTILCSILPNAIGLITLSKTDGRLTGSKFHLWTHGGEHLWMIDFPDIVVATFFQDEDRLVLSGTQFTSQLIKDRFQVFVYDLQGKQISNYGVAYYRQANHLNGKLFLPQSIFLVETPYPFIAQEANWDGRRYVTGEQRFGKLAQINRDLEYNFKTMYFAELPDGLIVGMNCLLPELFFYDRKTIQKERSHGAKQATPLKGQLLLGQLDGWRKNPDTFWEPAKPGDIETAIQRQTQWLCSINLIEGLAAEGNTLVVIYDKVDWTKEGDGEVCTGFSTAYKRFTRKGREFHPAGPPIEVEGQYMGVHKGNLLFMSFPSFEPDSSGNGLITPLVTAYPLKN